MPQNWFFIFSVKVTASGSLYIYYTCNENITIFKLCLLSKLLVCLQPKLVLLYHTISQSVPGKNWITVFKVKVTAKVQNLLTTDQFVTKLGIVSVFPMDL